jgi:hypothetical protein
MTEQGYLVRIESINHCVDVGEIVRKREIRTRGGELRLSIAAHVVVDDSGTVTEVVQVAQVSMVKPEPMQHEQRHSLADSADPQLGAFNLNP